MTSLVTAVPLAAAAQEQEPNDTLENAQSISVGETITGSTPTEDDEDWFRFRAATDARVVANVSYDTSANDLSLELTDASGATVATGGDGLATNVSTAGTYYLEVSGRAGAQATYALELNVSSSAPPRLPGAAGPPTDTDGDGLCEDVDGNGAVDVFDVALLLEQFGSDPVQNNPGTFDFDGQDGVNIFDVAQLLAEVP